MDNDTLFLILVLVLGVGSLVYGGFYLGRQVEKKYWVKYIPDALNQTCLECAGFRPEGR